MFNKKLDRKVHLSYRDILLVPYDNKPCEIQSRNDPSIYRYMGKQWSLDKPIIVAPMNSIVGPEMVIASRKAGAMAIIPRQIGNPNEIEIQIKQIKESCGCACAIGVYKGNKIKFQNHAHALFDAGCRILCIDVQNANHKFVFDLEESFRNLQKIDMNIIVGNVASGKAAKRLSKLPINTIKVGIGPGAVCTTRSVTGFGYPQLSAVMDVAKSIKGSGKTIIADGGIRSTGDCVKALWAGADAAMIGYLFSGHIECPERDSYRGMSSFETHKRKDVAAEGIEIKVKAKGSVIDTIEEMSKGIKAGLSMANAKNIEELRKNVRAIRVSTMSDSETNTVGSI